MRKIGPYLHILALTALVGAYPLLDLLAQHPEVMLARGWETREALVLTLVLLFVLPLPVLLLRALSGAVAESVARGLDAVFAGFATTLLFLQLAPRSISLVFSGHPVVAFSGIAGTVVGLLYFRSEGVRSCFSLLVPLPLVVALVFLLNPRVARINAEAVPEAPPALGIEDPPPVVLVIFDALSASALIDESGRINARRYPHLAALAEEATWFENAWSVSRWTERAIPSILTGSYPAPDALPRLADHPRNLFTLLHGTYQIFAEELSFQLCPRPFNSYLQRQLPPALRWRIHLSDLSLIYLHRTLPPGYTGRLPRVDQHWVGFAQARRQRVDRFHDFLDVIDRDGDGKLYYLHVFYPHMPYLFLPSGKYFRLEVAPALRLKDRAKRQEPDLEALVLRYKQYLFQVGYVDGLVGELVARLKDLGLYDRSLLVVTADHGGRSAPLGYESDVFSVPLLVRRPHQSTGEIRRDRVSTLDLLPSLLDLLGASPAWEMDGESFFAPGYKVADRYFQGEELRSFDPSFEERRRDLVRWKLEHFGSGRNPQALYRAGAPRPELLDRRLDELGHGVLEGLEIALDLGDGGIDYDPAGDFAPVLLDGSLRLDHAAQDGCVVAVSVNGKVEATATARAWDSSGGYRFRATVPESVFRAGRNDVRAWVVAPAAGEPAAGEPAAGEPGDPPRLLGPPLGRQGSPGRW